MIGQKATQYVSSFLGKGTNLVPFPIETECPGPRTWRCSIRKWWAATFHPSPYTWLVQYSLLKQSVPGPELGTAAWGNDGLLLSTLLHIRTRLVQYSLLRRSVPGPELGTAAWGNDGLLLSTLLHIRTRLVQYSLLRQSVPGPELGAAAWGNDGLLLSTLLHILDLYNIS